MNVIKTSLNVDQENKENVANGVGKKGKCDICHKSIAQYVCPRCHLCYCSLKCYQDTVHLKCSEEFYKEEVLNELKMCKIDDKDAKSKIAEILVRDAKSQATNLVDEDVCEDGQELADRESNIKLEEMLKFRDDDELLRAYESEIKNWRPWWLSQKQMLLIEDLTEAKLNEYRLNKTLFATTYHINVTNASELIYHDILQNVYLYLIINYVYQLNDDDFCNLGNQNFDLSLIEEICFALLQVDKLIVNNLNKNGELKFRFNLIIVYLLEVGSYFLKNYINKGFLLNLLNDLIFFCRYPSLAVKSLSQTYDLMHNFLKRKTLASQEDQTIVGKIDMPINVFHLNRSKDAKIVDDGSEGSSRERAGRVEILSRRSHQSTLTDTVKRACRDEEKKLQTNGYRLEKVTRKDAKLFMKRLEFYFKWLTENLNNVKNQTLIGSLCDDLNSLKDVIHQEVKEFNANKEIINRNLDFIRKKISNKKLIEEI